MNIIKKYLEYKRRMNIIKKYLEYKKSACI